MSITYKQRLADYMTSLPSRLYWMGEEPYYGPDPEYPQPTPQERERIIAYDENEGFLEYLHPHLVDFFVKVRKSNYTPESDLERGLSQLLTEYNLSLQD